MKFQFPLIFNSFVLYVTAFLITTILHESAHAIVGMFFDSGPVLHHNFVSHLSLDAVSVDGRVDIALSGPLLSLIQGFLATGIFAQMRRNSLIRLFVLWLATLGFTNFFGYLMTGPVFHNGDIGKVFLLLEIPLTFQILIALIGAGILVYIGYKLTKPFLSFCADSNCLNTPKLRSHFSFQILILPWVFGSIVMTILYLPVVAIVSMIYPFFSGMIFIFPWKNARRIKNRIPATPPLPQKISIGWLLFLVVLIAIFKFVLAPGIPL